VVWQSLAWIPSAPAQAPAVASPNADGPFQAYPLQHASAESLRDSLIGLLQNRGDVQVVADSRQNQLLVRGPADAQQLAAQLLKVLDKPPAADPVPIPTPAPAPPATPPPSRFQTRHLALGNARTDQVETLLAQLFGDRLARIPHSAGELPGYRLNVAPGEPVHIEVDAPANRFLIHGPGRMVDQVEQLIAALDSPRRNDGRTVRIIPLRRSDPAKVRQAFEAYRGVAPVKSQVPGPQRGDQGAATVNAIHHAANTRRGNAAGPSTVAHAGSQPGRRPPLLMQTLFQVAQAPEQPPLPPQPEPPFPPEMPQQELTDEQRRQLRELGADVDIESLEDLDVIILRGRERDVQELMRIIEEIERISAETVPQIEVIPLEHANSYSVGRILTQIQAELLVGRQGRALAVPLRSPNAMLLVGWGEAQTALRELIGKLDQPISPAAQFRVFPLKHAAAAVMEQALTQFFTDPTPGAPPRASVTADRRTNSVIVQGSPTDLAEAEVLLQRLDVPSSSAVNVLRVFRLTNSLAIDLAPALQAAISGAGQPGAPTPGGPAASQRIESLEFFTLDAQGQQLLRSADMTEVRITTEPRTNTLIVSAPAESIDLIAALIRQLDQVPATTAQIKVFHIVNGDASRLVEMLQALLGTQAVLPGGPQLAGAEGEGSLAPLRFSVDQRTNTIVASGSPGDLTIVEAILLRLDESDVQERRSIVYRLKNAPAFDVATAVNEYLRSERRVQAVAPGTFSPFQRIESEVVIVPEPVSNSLILSATPRYYNEIVQVVERLDAEPPQVMIQVLIADIQLNSTEEFGIELGIQDSVLFDRSLLSNIFPANATTPGQILSATNTPGFNFNSDGAALGNSGSAQSLATAGAVGTQGLTNFGVGRTSADAGFGGLVLSASSENVSVLIRALREKRRVDVLARPQVMTLDNQPAFIQVGQRVPRVASVSLNSFGQVSNIDLLNVGLILGVTPRISPDGMVVMEIDAERSEVGPDSEGIPVASSVDGGVIRSPRINVTTAQTTVSAADGQTIVLGGLITKTKRVRTRRVPYLSDVPVLGMLFRYDFSQTTRNELLIILTPRVVRSESEANQVKQTEAARMSWCLGDVEALHGDTGIHRRGETEMDYGETTVVYPDLNPRGVEPVDTPPASEPGPMLTPPGNGVPNGSDAPMLIPRGELPPPPGAAAVPHAPGGQFSPARITYDSAPASQTTPQDAADRKSTTWKLPGWPGKTVPDVDTERREQADPRIGPRPDATPYLPATE
jgi:type II secretion system protein D